MRHSFMFDPAAPLPADPGSATLGADLRALRKARGLTLADVDIGDVTLAELGEAGVGVFAADVGSVVGPLPSTLD